ncbi:hypothetical protein K1719_002966 [Acacia pycnantha]|nr:hypothetical protein K1719_002966 [Acacia pycnantha]
MEPSTVDSYSTPSPVRRLPTDVSYSTPPPAPMRKCNAEDSYSTPPAWIRKRPAEDSYSTPPAAMRKLPAQGSYSTPPAPKKKRPAELTPNELVKMFLNSTDEVYLSIMEQLLALYVIPEDEAAKRQRQMQVMHISKVFTKELWWLKILGRPTVKLWFAPYQSLNIDCRPTVKLWCLIRPPSFYPVPYVTPLKMKDNN